MAQAAEDVAAEVQDALKVNVGAALAILDGLTEQASPALSAARLGLVLQLSQLDELRRIRSAFEALADAVDRIGGSGMFGLGGGGE